MGEMKAKLIPAALACLCLSPAQADADSSASMQLQIEGVAEKVCILPEPRQTLSENAAFTGGQVVEIQQMIDEADATLNAASIRLEYPDVMCNYPAKVSISTVNGGLIRNGSDQAQAVTGSGDLLEKVDYRLTARWGSVELPDLATAGAAPGQAVSVEAGGANLADLIIDIVVDDQDTPVLTGQYTDDIQVTVGLQH
jgi:hypothetical protein